MIQAYVEDAASGRSMVDGPIAGDDYAFFDLFRVKDGKIVEHWDVQEKILPEEQWGNSGKF